MEHKNTDPFEEGLEEDSDAKEDETKLPETNELADENMGEDFSSE